MLNSKHSIPQFNSQSSAASGGKCFPDTPLGHVKFSLNSDFFMTEMETWFYFLFFINVLICTQIDCSLNLTVLSQERLGIDYGSKDELELT